MATRLTPWQDKLIEYCTRNNLGQPRWQDISDRRGGRTAWSSIVVIQSRQIYARYWYDGPYALQAREDAAEEALMALGAIPPPSRFGRPYGVVTW